MVSTIEPRKNHVTLLSAWERLRASTEPDLKLVLGRRDGLELREIVRKFLPWIERGELKLLEDVPSNELRQLYRHAAATVCPSVGEGFDFSGVEAMRCGRPLSPPTSRCIARSLATRPSISAPTTARTPRMRSSASSRPARAARRAELIEQGASHATQYTPEQILPLWDEFLKSHFAATRQETQ